MSRWPSRRCGQGSHRLPSLLRGARLPTRGFWNPDAHDRTRPQGPPPPDPESGKQPAPAGADGRWGDTQGALGTLQARQGRALAALARGPRAGRPVLVTKQRCQREGQPHPNRPQGTAPGRGQAPAHFPGAGSGVRSENEGPGRGWAAGRVSGPLCCNWDHVIPEQGHPREMAPGPTIGGSLAPGHPLHPGSWFSSLPAHGRYVGKETPSSGERSRVPGAGPLPTLTDATLSRSSCVSSSCEVGSVEPTCPSRRGPGLPEHGAHPPHPPPRERRCASCQPTTASLGCPGTQGLGLPSGQRGRALEDSRCFLGHR